MELDFRVKIVEILKGTTIAGGEGDNTFEHTVWLGFKGGEDFEDGEVGMFVWEAGKEYSDKIDMGEFETGGNEGEFEIKGKKLKYGIMYS